MPEYIRIKNYNVRINSENVSSYFPIDLVPKKEIDESFDDKIKDWWNNPQPTESKDFNIKETQYYIGFCFIGDKDYVKKFIFKNKEERDYALKELDKKNEVCCLDSCVEQGTIKRGSKVVIDLWNDNFWKTVNYKGEKCITYKGRKISMDLLQKNSWSTIDVISDEDLDGILVLKNKEGEIFEIHKNLLKLFS
jgi:hypothetical protein